MIDDLALRWVVTGLFGASIAGYVYILAVQRGRWTCTVNHLLHLAVSMAMVVMAWPSGMGLSPVGPMVFFLRAAAWFLLGLSRMSSGFPDRLINGYHAAKMTAMAWMYAVMSGSLPGQTCHPSDHVMSGSPGMHGTEMDMSGSEMSWTACEPGWVTTINSIATVGFAAAALYWLYRYFAERRTKAERRTDAERKTNAVSRPAQLANLAPICQAFMAAGAAIMFGVML